MAKERTFVMLKPGVIQRRLIGTIVQKLENKGLTIIAMKLRTIDKLLAESHYAEHKGKVFFAELVDFIVSGPVLAMLIEGDNAIALVRKLCGATKVEDAAPGTIRGDFALHTGLNLIHASDSPTSAERETHLFFSQTDIVQWEDPNHGWI